MIWRGNGKSEWKKLDKVRFLRIEDSFLFFEIVIDSENIWKPGEVCESLTIEEFYECFEPVTGIFSHKIGAFYV